MSAWTELSATGRFGSDGARLMYDVTGAVARGGGYPSPSGGPGWREQEVQELAHSVMADEDGQFYAEVLAHSVDDVTLKAHLHRLVQRRLADAGRQNTKGALIRRLRPLLKDARFARVGRNTYTVAGGPPPAVGAFHPDDLRAAADGVPVTPRVFGEGSRRRSPHGTDASLVEVCAAVLTACPHPLEVADLAEVVGRRIGMQFDEPERSFDSPRPPPEPEAADHAVAVGAAVDAERVWAELDADERTAVLVLSVDAREAAPLLGVGKTKANRLQRGALAAIAAALGLGDVPDSLPGLRAVLAAADAGPVLVALDRLARDRVPSGEWARVDAPRTGASGATWRNKTAGGRPAGGAATGSRG